MSNTLIKSYHHLKQFPDKYVLATIIETMGSTYQKAGARMLISQDGDLAGLLGGGCFETDLQEHAMKVIESGQAKIVFYDMRSPDDAIWGLGLGCNGAVRILLQALSPENAYTPFDQLESPILTEKSGVLVTICESETNDYKAGSSIFFQENADLQDISFVSNPTFVNQLQAIDKNTTSLLVEHKIAGKKVTVFYDRLTPVFKLLIIGAGPDAVPMTRFAKLLGWQITLVDHREEFIKKERFPDVDHLLTITPSELKKSLSLDHIDAVILMTHSIDYDERFLSSLVSCKTPYIGLLGPAKRKERLLATIENSSVTNSGTLNKRVFGPTGLDIGAQSPEEIALSVIAEIQAISQQRDGHSLSEKDLPIH